MSTLIFFASRLLFQTHSCNRRAQNVLSNSRLAESHLKNTPKTEKKTSRAPIRIKTISLGRGVWSRRPATHAVPSTARLELFEQERLVYQRCPQNKTLLRKHHHQPRQRVCRRRRRGDRKSRHLHFNNQFPTVRGGGRGQMFVVALLGGARPISAGLLLFFFFARCLFFLSIYLSISSLPPACSSLCIPCLAKSKPASRSRATKCLQLASYCIFDARLLDFRVFADSGGATSGTARRRVKCALNSEVALSACRPSE